MESSNWSTIYGFFSFVAGFLSVSIAIYLSPYWKNISARLLMLLMISGTVWSMAYGMELISPNLNIKLWWVKTEYFGAVWVGLLLFCFIISVACKKWHIKKTGYALLSIIPIITIILVLTNNSHNLMWDLAWIDISGRAPAMSYIRGPGFWGYVVYAYLLLILSTIALIHSLISARGIFKKQLITVLIGISFPWIANFMYLFGSHELKLLDLTPVSFTISGIAFSWGLFRYQMLSIIPLAREAVIDSMDDPLIALDTNDLVLDMNRAAKSLFSIEAFTPAHNELKNLIPVLYGQVLKHRQHKLSEVETSFMVEALQKHWNLRVTPLLNKKDKQTGWMILLRDITDKKNAEHIAKESGRIHKIMLEASPNPIVYYNKTGEVTYINPAFTRVFGWHLDEIIGKRIDFVP
ncbi:MAG: PAS domain-containing protein, partial [Desulfobacteraceae bacterium]|nr:PAS domain-containing protein [Desulfobacteraceae bacterium]